MQLGGCWQSVRVQLWRTWKEAGGPKRPEHKGPRWEVCPLGSVPPSSPALVDHTSLAVGRSQRLMGWARGAASGLRVQRL